jgi:succinate dehydrogenase/fumarate reductase flavoprotein subunit
MKPGRDEYDVIVLGAGAAGMTAACVAASRGARTLLLEKTPRVGGTTAISGGMVWLPGNPKFPLDERRADREAARVYLDHTLPEWQDRALIETYLARAGEVVDHLEAHTAVRFRPVAFYPDYYPDLPGAAMGGRVLEPQAFDARDLGPAFALLSPPLPEFTLFGGMMVDRADIPHLRNATKSPASALRVARLLARHARDRLSFERGAHLVLGNALAARLLKSVLDSGVELLTSVADLDLSREGSRIVGITLAGAKHIRARRGVVLATGGFSHDPAMRARYLPGNTGPSSAAAASNTGDGLRLGLAQGARMSGDHLNNAFWVPSSRFVRADGAAAVYPHTVTDRGKPGVIAVDARGRRFVNEAQSYHEFVQAMFRADAIPAWLVCDRAALWRYGLGAVRPFTRRLAPHLESGYLKRADSIEALARTLGIDAAGLQATVARFNEDARAGVDREFGKGSNAYHRYVGDAAWRPNPCLAPIEAAPFHAVAVYPGDLGTSAGLVTNEWAQVLDADGQAIDGLYACGNDMGSIMKGAYPGPGITLGPAIVFGYLAAMKLTDAPPAGQAA